MLPSPTFHDLPTPLFQTFFPPDQSCFTMGLLTLHFFCIVSACMHVGANLEKVDKKEKEGHNKVNNF